MNHQASERSQSRQLALTLLAAAVVVGSGVLLGRVLVTPQWTQAVTVIGLGATFLLLLISPPAGLLLWILLAPYSHSIYLRVNMGGGIPDLDLTRLTTVFLAFLLVLQATVRPRVDALAQRRLARPGWPELAMVAFVITMALSIPSSSRGIVANIQAQFDFMLIPLLIYYFARNLLRSERALAATIGMLALAAVLLGAVTVREQLTGQALFPPFEYPLDYEPHIRKVLSLFGSPTTIVTALAASLPLLLYGIRQARTFNRRAGLGVAVIVALAGLFFAYVRAGWLGAVVGVILVVALSPGLRRTFLPLLPVIVLVAVVASAVVAIRPEVVQQRLTSEQPITYRLEAWEIAWNLFQRAPFLGVGFGEFGRRAVMEYGWDPFAVKGIVGSSPAVHNSYLDALISGGLLAFIPYLGIFLALFQRGRAYWSRPANRDLIATLWATLGGYLLIIGTYDVLNAQYANMVFFLIMGTLVGRLEEMNGEVLT